MPEEALRTRQRGTIRARGWEIQYLFGSDEHGEYLDFFACHRMTNSRHQRLYASGATQMLESYEEWFLCPSNATEDEMERARQEYQKRNQLISQALQAKGFD